MATSKAIIPHEYRYSVEVRHRAFFEDPRSEQQLERALGDVGAEWVTFERRCCPFSNLQIEAEPNDGPVWLRMTGAQGIKPFILSEIGG